MSTRQKGLNKMSKATQNKLNYKRRLSEDRRPKKYSEMTPVEKKRAQIKVNKRKRRRSHNTIPPNLRHKIKAPRDEYPEEIVLEIPARQVGKRLARQGGKGNAKKKG